MTHMVATPGFNGPLELLLELSERKKIALDQVSVGQITSNFLALISERTGTCLDETADFLGMGCRLAYIKSACLLPVPASDDSLSELRQLTRELEEYRHFRAAAQNLSLLARSPSYGRQRASRPKSVAPIRPDNVSVTALQSAFTAIMGRHRPIPGLQPKSNHLKTPEARDRLVGRLATGPIMLEDLRSLAAERTDIITIFSVLLELVKSGLVRAYTDIKRSSIVLEAAND